MLPRVVDLVSDSGILVIAAGGIVDGHGYVKDLDLSLCVNGVLMINDKFNCETNTFIDIHIETMKACM